MRAAAALAVSLSVVAAGYSGKNPSASVLFTRGGGPRIPDLYVVRLDRDGVRLFLKDGADPAVSPDGRRIAFVRRGAIWIVGRDGKDPRPLTGASAGWIGGDSGPAWSADGKTVYFERSDDSDLSAIFSTPAHGGSARQLTPRGRNAEPTAAPHAAPLLYETSGFDAAYYEDARIASVGSRAPFRLPAAWSYDPAYAPDGRAIAFIHVTNRPDVAWWDLEVARSHSLRRLVRRSVVLSEPAWSHDAHMLAFAQSSTNGGQEGEGDIWTVGVDGSHLRQLTHGPASDSEPAWLPAA